ncbi:MAG: hypothetical protein PUH99_06910 [Firmicutes bacterium]|nr:hypothetical protein [Bacillota bacterium]MDY5531975.1 hypothetical protein [Pumilibacteraceae bacterium]
MVIGYVLLGLIAVMMFFGLLNDVVKSMKIEPWIALVFVIAYIVGGVIPMIYFGSAFALGIGGFIVPLVLSVVLTVFAGFGMTFLRTATAMLATAAITVAVTVWMPLSSVWMSVLASCTIGILGGAVSYAICQSRISSAAGSVGGVVLGNIIGQFIVYFTGISTVFTLGGSMIFDASVITLVFSVILASVAYEGKTTKRMQSHSAAEAGEDNADMDEFDDFLNK